MRILVTGANGQVGRSMLDLDGQDGHEIIGLTRQQFDLTKPEEFDRIVDQIEPDAIVNAAAYTAVDKAENEVELAREINAIAPGVMASIASKCAIPLIHVSTDYVFDGLAEEPYLETDLPNPINEYGKSKWLGESLILESNSNALIIRTSAVHSLNINNFVKTIFYLSNQPRKINVVSDQTTRPTYAPNLAIAIRLLLENGQENLNNQLIHYADDMVLTWYEFANVIAAKNPTKSAEFRINPCSSKEYGSQASRPPFSVLDTSVFDTIYPNFEIQKNPMIIL